MQGEVVLVFLFIFSYHPAASRHPSNGWELGIRRNIKNNLPQINLNRHPGIGRDPVLLKAKLVSFGVITQVVANGDYWIPHACGMTTNCNHSPSFIVTTERNKDGRKRRGGTRRVTG